MDVYFKQGLSHIKEVVHLRATIILEPVSREVTKQERFPISKHK